MRPKGTPTMKRYNSEGMRLTDCCGAYSTYCQSDESGQLDTLCCKACYAEVPFGQGDGGEHINDKSKLVPILSIQPVQFHAEE